MNSESTKVTALTPEQILELLDEQQRAAAESVLGPTVILAGAGTGKTRTVTHRIAYGIARGYYAPNRILALTYTNRAAGELRDRLRRMGIVGVSVKTFHAAALSQLEYFWPQYAGVPAPLVIESKARFIARAAESQGVMLDTAGVRELASEIEWRKFSMLSLDEYAQVRRPAAAGLSHAKNVAIQEAYENLKTKEQRLDWEDVLVLCLGLLRAEPRALAHVQQQYRFFTVDEYQDISPLQHALLDEWLGGHSDLCVVGDPNQTIYSFTGASAAFLQGFANRFDGSTVVELTTNYRSTPAIVETANRLLRGENSMAELVAANRESAAQPVVPRAFDSVSDELNWVAYSVRQRLEQGVPASQIAILYRVNGQSEAIENALARQNVEYQLRGGQRFFARPEIVQAMLALRAEAISPSAKPLFQTVSDICRSLGWQSQPPEHSGATREKWESLNALIGILDELDPAATIVDFVAELDERQRSQHEPTKEAVTLSTIHAAKGLEWQVVYVVGLTEGYLPIAYAESDAAIAEERRLLYVAITRARTSLQLTFARRDVGGRPTAPSRFLSSLSRHAAGD
ncbi:MAG: ATP-dependent helicase [Actinomycetales bacterium]|nr:ATP-dependent helicase [Actinomycetales bacterium]